MNAPNKFLQWSFLLHIMNLLLTLIMSIQIVGCAPQVKNKEEKAIESTTFSFDVGSYPSSENLFDQYHITPGDQLDVLFQIQTWKRKENYKFSIGDSIKISFVHTPELDQEQLVHPDGNIFMPYIGTVSVMGKTPQILMAELKQKYAKILRTPDIYVSSPDYSSQIKELKKDLHTASRGLSRLVTVRPDGYTTFPLVGDWLVANKTIPQVNEELDAEYDKILTGLFVNLFLEKTTGSVVYMVGEVKSAGAYQIERPIGIVEALALAGGQTSEANLNSVIVFRRDNGQLVATRVDVQRLLNVRETAEFFYLRPEDTVYVPRSPISTLAQLMQSVSQIIFFRGWHLSGTLFRDHLIDLGTGEELYRE